MERMMECNRTTSVCLNRQPIGSVVWECWTSIGPPYGGGMRIEHSIVLDQYPVTILTERVPDQAVLSGIITTLFERGCPLQSAECVEAQETD